MSAIDDIITKVIKAEGGHRATDDPNDAGGRTQYGIAERSNPEAWKDGKVTEEEARQIYLKKYVEGPGFDKITNPRLQHLLVDFGVNSGPMVAIQCLQRAVGAKADGVLGPRTLAATNSYDSRILTNRLVVERVKMIGRIVSRDPSQIKFINGWLDRALSFMVY